MKSLAGLQIVIFLALASHADVQVLFGSVVGHPRSQPRNAAIQTTGLECFDSGNCR